MYSTYRNAILIFCPMPKNYCIRLYRVYCSRDFEFRSYFYKSLICVIRYCYCLFGESTQKKCSIWQKKICAVLLKYFLITKIAIAWIYLSTTSTSVYVYNNNTTYDMYKNIHNNWLTFVAHKNNDRKSFVQVRDK